MKRRRLVLVVLALALPAWWLLRPDPRAPARKLDTIELARRVLGEIAGAGGEGITWETASGGVSVINRDEGDTIVTSSEREARIHGHSWEIGLELTRLTDIQCVFRFVPGMMLTEVSFRGEPDGDARPRELLAVGYAEYRREEFDRLCDEHLKSVSR